MNKSCIIVNSLVDKALFEYKQLTIIEIDLDKKRSLRFISVFVFCHSFSCSQQLEIFESRS